jgi:tetratricopeptide (TPR) repeat protein
MGELGVAVKATLAIGEPKGALVVPFPAEGRRPPQLRKLRDRLFQEGKVDLAIQAAVSVAKLDPGRESFFRLGFLYREGGRYQEALKTLRDALRFESGAAYVVPEIHLHIAYTWFLLGKRKRMGEALRRAYSMRWKPRSAAKFHQVLGTEHFAKRRYREAGAEYARAEAASAQAIERGRAAVNQGVALFHQWKLDEALIHLDRAVRLHKRRGQEMELTTARFIRAAVCFESGHLRRALGIFERSARSFRKLGKVDREADACVNAGYIAGEMGLWAKSRALADRAIQLASRGGGQHSVLAAGYACRATCSAMGEDFEQAEQDLAWAKQALKGRRDSFGVHHLCRAQARIARLFGSWKEVLRAARHGERSAKRVGDTPRVVEFRRMRAEAERHLGRSNAATMAERSAARLEKLLGVPSPKVRGKERIHSRLAATNLSILIVGENDTGKVELARKIHQASRRAKGPCEVVWCEHLSFPASDLGGHTEGAWSGAAKESIGTVRQAEGGTLILDGVDELGPEAQRVLLRILDGRVRAVGATEEKRVDVRVIGTCRDQTKLIPELKHRL